MSRSFPVTSPRSAIPSALVAFAAISFVSVAALAQTPPSKLPFPGSSPFPGPIASPTASPAATPSPTAFPFPLPSPPAPGSSPTRIKIPKPSPPPPASPGASTPYQQSPQQPSPYPQPYPQPSPGQRGPYQQQPNSQYFPYGGGPQAPQPQGPYGQRSQGPYQQQTSPRRSSSSSSSSRLSSDETLEKHKLRGTFSGNILGFGLTSTSTQRASAPSQEALSFGVASSYDLVGSSNGMGGSARVHWRGALGGGGAGFDGRYESLFTIGPVFGTEQVGIAPRIGMGGNIRGNDRYYRANLALPRGDLALDIHPIDGLFLEGGVTGAYNLVGRFNVEDTNRRTGEAWQAGFFGVAAISILSGTVQGTREYVNGGPGTPIDTLEINGCLNPFSALALCANYVSSKGDTRVGTVVTPVGVQTLGISLGIGVVGTR